MSRDYKPRAEEKNNGNQNPFLTGLMIGFLCGVIASLALVMFIKGKESPFAVQNAEAPSNLAERIQEDAKKSAQEAVKAQSQEKTQFDFYTILPGAESKVTAEEERQIVQQETPQEPVEKVYYLQVGAFQTEVEADNMKASLALQGFEAVVQTAEIPEKGTWHRVRVGPLKNLDQINQTKENLLANGFKSDLIKVNN
jgi:cell division protein FtsN